MLNSSLNSDQVFLVRSNMSRTSRRSNMSRVSYRSNMSRRTTQGSGTSLKENLLRSRHRHSSSRRLELEAALSKVGRRQQPLVKPSKELEVESENKKSFSNEINALTKIEAETRPSDGLESNAEPQVARNDSSPLDSCETETNALATVPSTHSSEPTFAALKSNAPIRSGYLVQRPKHWFGSNRRRYVVLRPSGLEIYESYEKFREGKLHSCHLLVGAHLPKPKTDQGKFRFANSKVTFKFIGTDEDDAERWYQALDQTICKVTPGRRHRYNL